MTNKSQWHEEHRKELREYYKERIRRNPFRIWAIQSRASHRRSGYKISITVDELEEMARNTPYCKFCGVLLVWNHSGKLGKLSPSADRIDNDGPFSADNIQIICNGCNSSKRDRRRPSLVRYRDDTKSYNRKWRAEHKAPSDTTTR